jgi:hypothetical protein
MGKCIASADAVQGSGAEAVWLVLNLKPGRDTAKWTEIYIVKHPGPDWPISGFEQGIDVMVSLESCSDPSK